MPAITQRRIDGTLGSSGDGQNGREQDRYVMRRGLIGHGSARRAETQHPVREDGVIGQASERG
jgi:hypothetical protein